MDAAERLSEETLTFLREQPGVTVSEIDTQPIAENLRAVQDDVAKELGVEDLLGMIREKASES